MPKTRFEVFAFTAITAFFMVYCMTAYNALLQDAHWTTDIFASTLTNMWLEYVLIGAIAFFFTGPVVAHIVLSRVRENTKEILVILRVQVLTVLVQVFWASFLGVWHANAFDERFFSVYGRAYLLNVAVAMPLQIFIVGPAARKIFRCCFRRTKEHAAS